MAASSWLCSIYVDIVARTESVVFQNSQWWEDAALIAIRVLVLRLTEPFHTLVTGFDSPIWTKNPRSWAERSRGGGCLTTSMAVREAAVRTNMYRHRWSWGEALLQFCASLSQPPMRVGGGVLYSLFAGWTERVLKNPAGPDPQHQWHSHHSTIPFP